MAFISDPHFHDVYGRFSDGAFPGLPLPGGERAAIRTMRAQLTSTRLFNENAFALRAALDQAVARGVRLIAFPGDLTDDGQPLHLRGLVRLLDEYAERHGVRFFATVGNHDPVRPFTRPAGKPDFLGEGGREQPIFSPGAQPGSGADPEAHPVIRSAEVQELGYREIMEAMAPFGMAPGLGDLHWESPWGPGQEGADPARRQATIDGAGPLPDASYLVEPVEGLWLLALDGNIYLPVDGRHPEGAAEANAYHSPGNAGFTAFVRHKRHLLAWMADVVRRAEVQGKRLVAFSHYPMVDYYRGAAPLIQELFGPEGLYLGRRPSVEATRELAATGLQLHFGGHMHANDTGVFRGDEGFLVNVQVPSTAAYVPAFKLLTLHPGAGCEVETIPVEEVARVEALFPLYREEQAHLQRVAPDVAWNPEVLDSPSYGDFVRWHIRELTRLRFLPEEWPADLRLLFESATCEDLLIAAELDSDPELPELASLLARDLTPAGWDEARERARLRGGTAGVEMEPLREMAGMEVATDLHRLIAGGELAFPDLEVRRGFYRLMAEALGEDPASVGGGSGAGSGAGTAGGSLDGDPGGPTTSPYRERMRLLVRTLATLAAGEPNDHLLVDFQQQEVRDLAGHRRPGDP